MLPLLSAFLAGILAIPVGRACWNAWQERKLEDLPTVDALKALLEKANEKEEN